VIGTKVKNMELPVLSKWLKVGEGTTHLLEH
jgi:hypothetical protein